MKIPNIPDPPRAVEDLALLTPVLFQALESGTQHAREYFEQQNLRVNADLYPSLVRFHARRLFDEYKEMVSYISEELSNNGLMLFFGRYRIRILKSNRGDVPTPGQSRAKQQFYRQSVEQPFLPFDAEATVEHNLQPVNLLVIWEVTSSYNLLSLDLVCPHNDELSPDAAQIYWQCPLPHPAEGGQTLPVAGTPPTDDIDDLDISLPYQEGSAGQVSAFDDDLDIALPDDELSTTRQSG